MQQETQAAQPAVSEEEKINLMADAIENRRFKPFTSEAEYRQNCKRHQRTPDAWEAVRARQEAALEVVDLRKLAKQRAEIKAKLATAHQQFVENDTGAVIPVAHIDRMERALTVLVAEDLDAFNAALKAKSSPITHRDVAFIACVHRLSVTDNGTAESRFAGTSPFKRMKKAAEAFSYRTKPFDDRQVRAALEILKAVGFTTEREKGQHSYESKDDCKAGVWSISQAPQWARIFA